MARYHLELAANGGLVVAQREIGYLLLHGKHSGIEKDISAGVAWLERATTVRPPEDAQLTFGKVFEGCRDTGTPGVRYDYAIGLMTSADAMGILGEYYESSNYDLAVSWFEKRIATFELAIKQTQGDARRDSMENALKAAVEALASMYSEKFNQTFRDSNTNPENAPCIGLHDDYWTKVAECFRKGATLGSDVCQNLLGWNYIGGVGVPIDIDKGLEWLTRSGVNVYDSASFFAQIHYELKDRRDDVAAVHWATKARDMINDGTDEDDELRENHRLSLGDQMQLLLARAHLYGLGTVSKDTNTGMSLLLTRPYGTDDFTRCELGIIYLTGYGVRRDRYRAAHLFSGCTPSSVPLAGYMQARLKIAEGSSQQTTCLKYHKRAKDCKNPIGQVGMNQRDLRRCEECRRDDALYRCRGCFVARYCSPECQTRGWREGRHKEECPMNFPCRRCARKTGEVRLTSECDCAARATRRAAAKRRASERRRREPSKVAEASESHLDRESSARDSARVFVPDDIRDDPSVREFVDEVKSKSFQKRVAENVGVENLENVGFFVGG